MGKKKRKLAKGEKNTNMTGSDNKHDDKSIGITLFMNLMKNVFHRGPPPIKLIGIKASHIESLTSSTDGFSGREIEKLMIAIQSSVYGSDSLELSAEGLMKEIKFKV